MDKIAHIKAEIERRMKLNSARAEIDKSSSKQGAANEDEELLAFIDFLPEEPVSSIWHDANEEPDMDARIVTLHEGNVISTTRRNYLHGMKRWNPDKWCYLKDILEKKEEPVKQSVDEAMAEVEEKAKLFTEAHKGESADEILSKMRGEEPVSEELEEFANKYAHNLVTPELYGYHIVDAVKAGAQWQKERMVDMACEWLKEQDEMIGISFKDNFCERFKKAMENNELKK